MGKTYSTIISVLDQYSGPIIDLEAKLTKMGNIGAAAQKKLKMSPTEKLWKQLTDKVGAAKARFGELGSSIGEMGGKLAEVLPMLGSLAGVGSFAGLLEMEHATSEAVEALRNMSLITGVAVPQLQSLDFASQQSGVSMEILGKGLERLNINLGKAAEGQNKNAAALFKAMGINLRDANGHVKNLTQIMPQLETAFQKTTDPTLRAAMAMTLFGKSGEELLPFLTQGPAAIAEMQKRFDEFGYSFSADDQKGLKSFQDSWNDAQLSVHGLSDEISAKLAPVMAPLLEDFATFVSLNRELIATDLANTLKEIAGDLQSIDWKGDAKGVEDFANWINKVVDHDHLGGWEGLLTVVGVAMALDFLAPIISLTAALTKLGFAMGGAILDPVVALVLEFRGLIPETARLRDVMAALDLAMEANPLGVAVIAATALAGLGLLVYDHWKPIAGFFDKVGDEIDYFNDKAMALDRLLGFSPDPGDISQGDTGGRLRYERTPAVSKPIPKLLPTPVPSVSVVSPAGGSNNGHVSVNVNLKGAPPGTTVSTSSSGIAKNPVVKGMNGTIANHRRE